MKKSIKKLAVAIMLMLMSFAFSPEVSAQCAMCKRVAETNINSGTNKVGRGLNNGIMYLLFVPYLLVGTGAFFFWRSRRKSVDELDESSSK